MALVADNHSANVNAYNLLLDTFDGNKTHYITLPNPPPNICFFILFIYEKIFVIVY